MSDTEIVKLREDVRDVVTLLADVMSATGGNDAKDFDHVKSVGASGSTLTAAGNFKAAGLEHGLGTRRFQTFAGSLAASTAATTAYLADDNMIELGTLDVSVNSGIVTPTKIFIHKAVVLITTAAGQTLVGNLALGTATADAENAAVTGAIEVVGAGVDSFSPNTSASSGATEIDINFNSAAAHVFEPNIAIAIANKYLYARATTTLNADGTAGRFTVELEYSIM